MQAAVHLVLRDADAAKLASGYSTNGPRAWKTVEGTYLGDLER